MKDYGIDKSLVQIRDDELRNQRGWSGNFFSFRKMFRTFLTKLNVPFFDRCCPEDSFPFPVRYNNDKLERFDGNEWVEVPIGTSYPPSGIYRWYSTDNPPIYAEDGDVVNPTSYSIKSDNQIPTSVTILDGTVIGQVLKISNINCAGCSSFFNIKDGSGGNYYVFEINSTIPWALFMWNGVGWDMIDYGSSVVGICLNNQLITINGKTLKL